MSKLKNVIVAFVLLSITTAALLNVSDVSANVPEIIDVATVPYLGVKVIDISTTSNLTFICTSLPNGNDAVRLTLIPKGNISACIVESLPYTPTDNFINCTHSFFFIDDSLSKIFRIYVDFSSLQSDSDSSLEISKLQQSIDEKNKEIDTLNQTIYNLTASYTSINQTLQETLLNLSALQENNTNLTSNLTAIKIENTNLWDVLANKNKEIASYQDQIQRLNNEKQNNAIIFFILGIGFVCLLGLAYASKKNDINLRDIFKIPRTKEEDLINPQDVAEYMKDINDFKVSEEIITKEEQNQQPTPEELSTEKSESKNDGTKDNVDDKNKAEKERPQKVKCNVCGWEWRPYKKRNGPSIPKLCPKCHSKRWNIKNIEDNGASHQDKES